MSIKDKLKWNEKYKQRLNKDNTENGTAQPNQRLTLFHKYFQGNKALDLACGLGTNSIYLAQLGYQVTAIDVSDVAIQHVNKLALVSGLTVEGKVLDLETSNLPPAEFDLVLNTFYLQRNLFLPMKEALKPYGYLFIETYFLAEENDPNPGMREEYKLKSQELLQVYKELKIIYYFENKETGIATLLAQKV